MLVKAAAGGGGKGMRIVRSRSEYDAALAAARREALSAFGDDTILIEKYVEHGRHIEVQVLADHHGNVVHLFERDCSTQRRHQKVLEEAPAPTITDAQRELVTGSAVALSREVGYTNAGTVEFLLDSDSGEVYFLEMNTRLQVEHPVTEEVVRVRGERIDLVELQLRVAAGEPLGFTQDDVTVEGHAIEARIYAEDSFGGFLPQAGTAELVRWPAAPFAERAAAVARSRTRAASASTPPSSPARSSARASTRCSARSSPGAGTARPRAPRWSTPSTAPASSGLTTNTGFVRALAAGDEFRDATIDTAWLDHVELDGARRRGRPGGRRLGGRRAAQPPLRRPARATRSPPTAGGWPARRPAPWWRSRRRDGRRELRVDVPGHRVDDLFVREHRLADHTAVLSLDGDRETAYVNATAHRIEVAHRGPALLLRAPRRLRRPRPGRRRRHPARADARHRPRRPRHRRPAGGRG